MTDRSDADRKPEETRGEGAMPQTPAASPAPDAPPPGPTVSAAPDAPHGRTAPGDPAAPVCEVCGTPMYDRHCKIVCPNCGYLRDCSDP